VDNSGLAPLTVMRIVHISDFHFQAWPRDWTAGLDKRLLGLLNVALHRRAQFHPAYVERLLGRLQSLAPDLVVISGDLTCIGSPEEFARARQRLAPLLRPGQPPCVYVPGNHDAYVNRQRPRAALAQAFAQFNNGRWPLAALPAELPFPNLRLLLLDECRPTAPWQSGGHLPAAARARLEAWLAEPRRPGEKRIIVGHFPCQDAHGRRLSRRRRLHGDADLRLDRALATGQADIALCGHLHTPFLRTYPNGAMEICAGALVVHGCLNVLDFSPLTGTFRQHWETLGGNGAATIPVVATAPVPVA